MGPTRPAPQGAGSVLCAALGVSRSVAVALAAAAGLAATAGGTCGPSGARAAEPTPIEVFQRFIRDRDPALRKKAVQALANERGADVVEALLLASRDEDAAVRDRAVAILLEGRDRSDEVGALARALGPKVVPETRLVATRALGAAGRAAAPALRTALADREADVRIAAARGLAAVGDRDAVRDLHALLTDREALVRAAACESIGDLAGASAAGTASAVALGDSAAEPRIAAVRVLARHAGPDSVAAVADCVDEPAWSLRVAAAKALAEHGADPVSARPAAAALVRALERESRNRVRVEMSEALWALTGIDFGPDPARWTKWFRETGGAFDPPPRRPRRETRDKGATFGGLADLPLESEHVAFVLDASSSMNDPVRFGAKRTKRDDLLDAFEAVLEKLPKPSWINVIPFSTEPKPMKPALFEATPAARQAAHRHLAKTPADGGTNIFDSLELALRDGDADTIVLLTDGAPSAGKRTSRTAILDGVRELNRYRLARIHTVEVGAANTGARWKGFLKDLADAAGGHHLSR